MKRDLHHIDDLFKAGLDGKEEQPDEKIWNAIEKDLDKDSIITIRKKYTRLRRASVILLILLLGISIYALKNIFDKNKADGVSAKRANQQNVIDRTPAKSQPEKNVQVHPGGVVDEPVNSSPSVEEMTATENANAEGENKDDADHQKSSAKDTKNSAVNKTATDISTNNSDRSPRSAGNSTGNKLDSEKAFRNSSGKNESIGKSSVVGTALISIQHATRPSTKNPRSGQKTSNNISGKSGIEHQSNPEGSAKAKHGAANVEHGVATVKPGTANTKSGQPTIDPGTANAKSGQATRETGSANAETSGAIVKPVNDRLAQVDLHIQPRFVNAQLKLSQYNGLTDSIKSGITAIPIKKKKSNELSLPRFSITPTASLNLMSNSIAENMDHAGRTGNEKEDIENTESEKLSYTFSMLFDVRVAKRITIQSGIGYMTKTTVIEPKKIPAVKSADGKIKYQFDCSAGRYFLNPKYGTWPGVGDSAYTIASANELHYINVPLAIKYYFGNDKLNFFATGGFDANILLGQDLTTGLYGASYYGKKSTPQPIGLNNVFVSGMIGGGLNYSLNRRFALTFSPTYRFALNPINKDMPFKAYPRSLTLAGGIRVSLW